MNIKKIIYELTYQEYVDELILKYGSVSKPYFNKNFNQNSSITKTKEGLYIHHIDENLMILLSNQHSKHPVLRDLKKLISEEEYSKVFSKLYFDFQKEDRLVYCDLLEHLLLHIKIIQSDSFEREKFYEEYKINKLKGKINIGIGGIINFFIPELNDIYSGIEYQNWKKNIVSKIKDQKQDYLEILIILINDFDINVNSLKTSFNHQFGIWDIKNNKELFDEIDLLSN